jgi:hypothetical protein
MSRLFSRTALRATLAVAALLLLFWGIAAGQDPGGNPGGATPPAGAAKGVRDLFKGKVVSLKGRRIEVSYDFSDPAQAQDWSGAYPFLRPTPSGGFRVEGKAVRGDGNAGWRLRAVFDGELKLTATVTCQDAQNFGVVVTDEDHTQFDLFALADTYFSLLDRKRPLQHMITTFQPAGQGPGGATEWRYVQATYEPHVGGEPFDISVRKRGALNEFRFGTGRLAGADKETKVGPRLAAGFYILGARVVVAKAAISGVLDAAWLRQQGVAFEDTVPEDPDPLEAEKEKPKEPSPGAPDAKGPGGSPEWPALAARVANLSSPREDREKAAESLIDLKERRALRSMIDLFYRDEDLVGRELGNRVFKGITGKETGFRADLPRESRLKIMPRVWEIWYAVKDQLDKEDSKKGKEK